jgi:adenosylcobinamide-GDP ribazoletransferase
MGRAWHPADGAVEAVSFLTPFGGARSPSARAVPWFPVVGAGLGAILGLAWRGASHVWPPALAAAVIVVADLVCTGLLHFDGLVDAADGLLPHLSRERRLEVMAAPQVGAFGVGVAIAVLLVRWAVLTALHPSVLLLAGLWAASRTVMAVTLTTVPYARAGGGLATAFRGGSRLVAAVGGPVLAVGLVLLWRPLAGAAAVVALAAAGNAVVALAWRRLGGFTGDVLGAAGVIGETVGLLVAAGKWR